MNSTEFNPSWTMCVLLLRTAVVTTLLLVAALVVLRLLRRSSAAVRHRLWLTGVLGCWAAPFVLACFPAATLFIAAEFEPSSPRAPMVDAAPQSTDRNPAIV